MIGMDQRKPQRLAGTYRDYTPSGVTTVNDRLSLDHANLSALVSMGPSARHITPQALAARLRSLPSPFTVTVDLQIRVFHRPSDLPGVTTPPRKR
jgi:23S rRNA (guanine745-N1)-methyltransferase